MKSKLALAFVLAAIAIGTAAIAQQPKRVAKVNGYAASGGISGALDVPRYRVGLINEALVPGQEAGVLVELNVKEGQFVKPGERLGKIDDSQPIMQGKIASAEHRAADEKAKSTVDIEYATKASEVALVEWEKSKQANQKQAGTVSFIELQRQKLTWERGKLEIKRAQSEKVIAGLTADAKAVEIEAADEAVKRRLITSPVDGVVVQVYLHNGEWVKPGDTVLHVVQLDKLKVEGDVEISRFSPSQIIDSPVTIEATLQDRKIKFEGQITFVKPLLDGLGKRYQIKAEVDNRKENGHWLLLPGLYVDMTIKPR